MSSRQLFVVVAICFGLALGFGVPLIAQNDASSHPTALELYEQAMDAYGQGQLSDARSLFRRVDPIQLPREQRLNMYKTLQELDERTHSEDVEAVRSQNTDQTTETTEAEAQPAQQPAPEAEAADASPVDNASADNAATDNAATTEPAGEQAADATQEQATQGGEIEAPEIDAQQVNSDVYVPDKETLLHGGARLEDATQAPTAEQLVDQADAAAKDGQLGRAAELYRQVATNDDANITLRAKAAARLAEVDRRIDSKVSQARESLEQARAEINAEQYDAAAQRLDAVKASGVNLGWFDQQRLERLSAAVDQHQAELAAAQADAEAKAAQAKAEADKATAEAQQARQAELDKLRQQLEQAQQEIADAQAAREAAEKQAEQAQQAAASNSEQAQQKLAEAQAAREAAEKQAQAAQTQASQLNEQMAKADQQAQQAQQDAEQSKAELAKMRQYETPDGDLLEQYRAMRLQQTIDAASKAADEGQYNLAIRHYETALQMGPKNPEELQNRIDALRNERMAAQNQTQPEMNGESGPQGLISRTDQERKLLIQRATLQYENYMNIARAHKNAGEFPAAQDAASQAKTVARQQSRPAGRSSLPGAAQQGGEPLERDRAGRAACPSTSA